MVENGLKYQRFSGNNFKKVRSAISNCFCPELLWNLIQVLLLQLTVLGVPRNSTKTDERTKTGLRFKVNADPDAYPELSQTSKIFAAVHVGS